MASSYAWERYRENWVQLDAPRHLFLHSPGSIELLSQSAGLTLSRIEYDSTEFQFTGSERYARGLRMSDPGWSFSGSEIRLFQRQARELNAQGSGDQAAFYFTKV